MLGKETSDVTTFKHARYRYIMSSECVDVRKQIDYENCIRSVF